MRTYEVWLGFIKLIMQLDAKQIQFIEKRKKFVRFWPPAGSLLLILLCVLLVWLYFRSPLLVNPFEVMTRLDAGTIEESTLLLSAVLLPVMTLSCIVVLIAMILLMFSAFSNEKKHLQLIEELLAERESSYPEAKPPSGA